MGCLWKTFIKNLLRRNDYIISYPTLDESGEIEFGGLHFSMNTIEIKVVIDIAETEDCECQLY